MRNRLALAANRFRTAAIVLVVLLMLIPPSALAETPVPLVLQSQLGPVIDQYVEEFSGKLEEMPAYAFDLALDPAQSTIGGRMSLTFPNQTGFTVTELPLRLYPNADYYDEGGAEVSSIAVDGIPVEPRYDDSGTVLFVDLPEPLARGDSVTVELEYETVVPRNATGSFGILNHDIASDQFVLSDWYPVVAGWDETGWRIEPPTEQGDPTFPMTSIYDATLSLPDGYQVVASGDVEQLENRDVRIVSGPVRDFALVVAGGLETQTAEVGDTVVRVHASPANAQNAAHVLETATTALEFYDNAFGPYPFDELDIVETPLSLAYGVSWSGLLFINRDQFSRSPDDLSALDFTLFHELGHQWWGGTVGANSNDHTFMVEGLTNATALLAQAAIQGPQAAANSLYAWVVTPYLNLLDGTGDGIPDVSIFDQPAAAPLSTLAYGKGALGFLAIRDQIGADAFIDGLARYAEAFRLGIAEPEDLLAAFETASGQELDDLWSLWFQSDDATRAQVEELVPRIIASFV